MDELDEAKIYELIGQDGFIRLVGGFYQRVRTDDVLGPLYPPDDFEAAEQRLRSFLIQRFGGPATYSQHRGHPRLRMRHAPFAVDQAARNRWVELMEQSMNEAQLPHIVQVVLLRYFLDTATHMINRT